MNQKRTTKNPEIKTESCDKHELIRQLENDLERILHFIGNCDQKASILLAMNGILLSMLFSSPHNTTRIISLIYGFQNKMSLGTLVFQIITLVLIIIALICLIISLWFIVCSIKANTGGDTEQFLCNNNSKVFFKTISDEPYNDFKNKRRIATDNERIDELISQLYINSRICNNKYSKYNSGLRILRLGFIFLCISFVLLVIHT